MSNASVRQERMGPSRSDQQETTDLGGTLVPAIPEWVGDWGWYVLAPVALATLWAIAHIGHVYGAGLGWTLLVTAVSGTVAVWRSGYNHRSAAAQATREQALYGLHEIAKIDAMTGSGFEGYSAELLRTRGYRDIVITGSTEEDHGADIIATAPDGTRVAVQCKRQKVSVGPRVIRELIGTTSSGKHQGRTGMLMTSAAVTQGAWDQATANGIAVVDRSLLQRWMSQARSVAEQRVHTPQAVRVAAGGLGTAVVLLIIAAFLTTTSTQSMATTRTSPSAVPASVVVVEEFFAAINRHDWQKVWLLAGRNIGRGPYASYKGMISGYRLTARDILIELKTRGDFTLGRILAYETTGAIQEYRFSYLVRDGMIVAGQQTLLGISHRPRPESSR